jgi:hypothetical protein
LTSSAESSDRWHERQYENVAQIQCDRDNPLIRVGKPRDILEILREGSDRKTYPNWHGICKAAADEIERLRELLGNPEQLRVERLRRLVNGTANTQGDKIAKEMHQNDGD